MIIPSIDLMDGQAVQLVGGKEKVLEAGDPRPLAKELAQATAPEQVAAEAADLMYFAMVALARAGVPRRSIRSQTIVQPRAATSSGPAWPLPRRRGPSPYSQGTLKA